MKTTTPGRQKKVAEKTSAPRARTPRTRAAARPRTAAKAGIATMTELMAHAYEMEAEAAERYAEFADAMQLHNNAEVAELFRKLARIEHRHSEQILETMGWVSPPLAPSGGYRWESAEGPETGDPGELHYLMHPYHALQIARHNELRACEFFARLAGNATSAALRKAAHEFAAEEAEHVRLIDEWLKRTPAPKPDWAHDSDPPAMSD